MARWRYWTEDALTGIQLHPALPLTGVEFTRELNGPGSFQGTLAPRFLNSNPGVVEPGRTLIYVEADGRLRWGGIVWDTVMDDGEYRVEAAGWSSYLHKRHDLHGELDARGPYTYGDPCQIIRDIWAYAQEQPDGDLGVTVDATNSSAKAGTPAEPWHSYWYETPVLGGLVDDLVGEDGSPDYVDDCEYQTNGTVARRVRLGWPRVGARRTDISFKAGVNIVGPVPIQRSGDEYANTIIATGSGEGTARRFAVDSVRDGGLRLETVLPLPDVNGTDVLGRRARAERERLMVMGTVRDLTIRHHPNAPLGSWQVGDDVMVQARSEWGMWSGWSRIVADSIRPGGDSGEDQIVLSVVRADSFHYGSASGV